MEPNELNQSVNPAVTPNQPTQHPIHNQRGNFPIILGIIVLLLVVGSGAYYLGTQKSNTANQTVNIQPTTSQNSAVANPTDTPVATQTPQSNEATTDWKTYSSAKAKYSFKYPTEWPLVNVPPSQGCDVCVEQINFTPKYNPNSGDGNTAIILIFKADNIKTLDDYVNIHVKGDSSKVNLQYTTVGGEKAVSYKLSAGIPPLPVVEYAVVKNGMYYIIRLDDSVETNKNKDKNLMLFNEMLTTFKFQ